MKLVSSLKYSFHVIFHPFDGFWDLKHEKRGSLQAGFFILLLLTAVFVMQRQTTGFIFNHNVLEDLNIFNELMRVIIPVGLWCVANWCLTTLMDGEGSFVDIVTTTAYATVPLILINAPLIILSNMVTKEEGTFILFFGNFAIVWTVFLLFVGMMTVHQYSPRMTIFSMVATVVGMGIILFLSLLFFYLIQELLTFGYKLYKEFIFR